MPEGVEGVIFAVALAIIVLFAEVSSMERKPYGSPAAIDAMRAVIEEGRKVATSTAGGVTIEVTPLAGERSHVELHLQRPTSTTTIDPTPQDPSEIEAAVSMTSDAGNATGQPFAIFISPHGAASASAWTPASGPLAAEPVCVNPVTLVFQNDGSRESLTMSCTDASISETQVR